MRRHSGAWVAKPSPGTCHWRPEDRDQPGRQPTHIERHRNASPNPSRRSRRSRARLGPVPPPEGETRTARDVIHADNASPATCIPEPAHARPPLPSPLRRMACVMAICAGPSAGTGPVMAAPPGTGPAIAAQASSSEVEFHGLAMAFVRFWDDTKHFAHVATSGAFQVGCRQPLSGFLRRRTVGSRVTQAQIDERIGEQMLAFRRSARPRGQGPEAGTAARGPSAGLQASLPQSRFPRHEGPRAALDGRDDGGTRSFAGPRTLILAGRHGQVSRRVERRIRFLPPASCSTSPPGRPSRAPPSGAPCGGRGWLSTRRRSSTRQPMPAKCCWTFPKGLD